MAQWGVHGTFLHHERITGRHGLHWTVGLDHDPSDRTSIALEFIGHFNGFAGEGMFHDHASYQGQDVFYTLTRKVVGMQYRSSYFLSNNNSGAYIGSYIGFRQFSRTVTTDGFHGTDVPAWTIPQKATTMLYPVGLRFGIRSDMDGAFMDAHVSVGYQIGHKNERLNAPYLLEKDALKGFSFQLGYAVGIGW